MERAPLRAAVDAFWSGRDDQARGQRERGVKDRGTRGSTAGGQHLNAVRDLLANEFSAAGVPDDSIHTSTATLPGYFRPTKAWDLVVTHNDSLVAAIELKSMVGSEGKNLNNRSEEAIGNAGDLKRAFEAELLGATQPWLGYFVIFGVSDDANQTRSLNRSLFPVDEAWTDTSYNDRWQMLLLRLVEEQIYDRACFIATQPGPPVTFTEPSNELSFERFREGIRECVGRLSG